MVFSCAPNFRAKASAKKQALKQRLAGVGAHHGVSLRLLLVDKQVDEQDALPHAALGSVHVVRYDAHTTTLDELIGLVREAHRQNTAPFLSIALAQHGPDEVSQWAWTSDLTVNLKSVHGAIDQLSPLTEVLSAALSKTAMGKAHVDFLACGLASACKGLVPALEKMYGIDFRASTDDTGNAINGGDWKMETDNDYDVAKDYLDAGKLEAYAEKMNGHKGAYHLDVTTSVLKVAKHTVPAADAATQARLQANLNKMADPNYLTNDVLAAGAAGKAATGSKYATASRRPARK